MLPWRQPLFDRYPWLPPVLPLLVFLVCGSLLETTSATEPAWLGTTKEHYPIAYAVRIALTLAAIVFVWPAISVLPRNWTPLSIIVGLIGGGVWIGLCNLGREERIFPDIGLTWWLDMGARQAFNPFENFSGGELYAFLAVRFVGLVLIVPLIEELFLRVFVMRFVVDPDWWKVPLGTITRASIAAGILVPLLMHPGRETFAALAWFGGLLAWFAWRKSFWDCVIVHAVTNLTLGIYVLKKDAWQLW